MPIFDISRRMSKRRNTLIREFIHVGHLPGMFDGQAYHTALAVQVNLFIQG